MTAKHKKPPAIVVPEVGEPGHWATGIVPDEVNRNHPTQRWRRSGNDQGSAWAEPDATPYGWFRLADGTEILFNRAYVPMHRRAPDGSITRAVCSEWVDYESQFWIYNSGKPGPLYDPAIKARCDMVLRAWGFEPRKGRRR